MNKSKMRFWAMLTAFVLLAFTAFRPMTNPVIAATTTTKIMPLGDSITDCDFWRTLLFNKLTENGYDVESVGTRPGNHEGHWGIKVTDIAKYNQLPPWLEASNPDIIIMHLGTNDCWQDVATDEIIKAYTTLVEQMRDNNPNMIIAVAQIIPLHPDDAIDYDANVTALNEAIVGWASDLTTEASPIIICDQYTGFDVDVDTYDGAHPSNSGSEKICDNWYEVLAPILSGNMPEVPVETPEPSTSPEVPVETPEPSKSPEVPVETPEPSTSPEVPTEPEEATLVVEPVVSSWGGGYTVTMNIKNTSDAAVTDWELRLNKAEFSIDNIWCAVLAEEGEELFITPMEWNSTIEAGASVSFGFQGTGEFVEDFTYTIK